MMSKVYKVFEEYPFSIYWREGNQTFSLYRLDVSRNEINVFTHAEAVPSVAAANEIAAQWWGTTGRELHWGPETWEVTHHGNVVATVPDENACFKWLMRHQGRSVYHAVTYEGYGWRREAD